MIPARLTRLSAVLFLFTPTGLSVGSDVKQTPILWSKEGLSATMNCNHTKDASYSQMYWYRQLPGEMMKLIVWTTLSPPHKYESGFSEDKFPAKKNNFQTGSLTVEKLLPGDSGVYFCAVSQHSDTGDVDGCSNTDVVSQSRTVSDKLQREL
uniref:Ig-like domain-containing protein n=1 Tax=Anabas testudineus TaxID=64144 RepID=A0A3Q1J3M5_ANATE